MMNPRRVFAVVLSSVASFWLAGCAADASAPTTATEGDENVVAAEPAAKPSEGASATLEKAPEPSAEVESDVRSLKRGGGGGGGAPDKASKADTCVAPNVTCACGVCAPLDRCVAICNPEIPQ